MKPNRTAIASTFALVLCAALATSTRAAHVITYRVVDGDTLEAAVRLEFGFMLPVQTYRMYNFDAWESRRIRRSLDLTPAQWDAEIVKGKAAAAALERHLGAAKVVEVREVNSLRNDPWGRVLIDLYADGQNVAAIMRSEGHERTTENPPATEKKP